MCGGAMEIFMRENLKLPFLEKFAVKLEVDVKWLLFIRLHLPRELR